MKIKRLSSAQLMALFLIGIAFVIVGVFGSAIPSYITTMIGFNFSAILFILLGVFLRSEEENPEILTTPVLWFLRVIIFGFATIQLILFFPFWQDLSRYLNKQYEVLEGYPSNVDYDPGGWSKNDHPTLYLTIDEKELLVDLYPENPEELYEKYIRIEYLPKTEWIVSIDVR
ncbi:hypothetical protein [Litchfieldia alkalitelluris]|uniref:hypothetical protein n=1 Tax=Litchfieldia alkalitelluris TaxID=304268 RepID=UPI000997D8AE|nr:hypothetical protein [Litchfieldia alkalitelluris]